MSQTLKFKRLTVSALITVLTFIMVSSIPALANAASTAEVLNQAVASAQKITKPLIKANALIMIGLVQIDAGDKSGSLKTLEKALKLSQSILNDKSLHPIHRVRLACKIARLQGEHDIKGTRRFLNNLLADFSNLKDAGDKSDALQAIARTEIQLNHLSDARKILSAAKSAAVKVDDRTERNRRLNEIALAYVLAGNARNGLTIARETIADGYYPWSIPTIASALSNEGDDELARDLLDELVISTYKLGPLFQAQELNKIAKAQLEIGDPERASQTLVDAVAITKTLATSLQVEWLSMASEIQAELDFAEPLYLEEALTITRKTEDQGRKIYLLIWLARSIAMISGNEKSLSILAEALDAAGNEKSPNYWVKQVAVAYAELGFPTHALSVLDRGDIAEESRVEALVAIAKATIRKK